MIGKVQTNPKTKTTPAMISIKLIKLKKTTPLRINKIPK